MKPRRYKALLYLRVYARLAVLDSIRHSRDRFRKCGKNRKSTVDYPGNYNQIIANEPAKLVSVREAQECGSDGAPESLFPGQPVAEHVVELRCNFGQFCIWFAEKTYDRVLWPGWRNIRLIVHDSQQISDFRA